MCRSPIPMLLFPNDIHSAPHRIGRLEGRDDYRSSTLQPKSTEKDTRTNETSGILWSNLNFSGVAIRFLEAPKFTSSFRLMPGPIRGGRLPPCSGALDFIYQAKLSNAEHHVLVNCAQGVSRSASVTIAYLMKRHGWDG